MSFQTHTQSAKHRNAILSIILISYVMKGG
jgi:hypothetical protein